MILPTDMAAQYAVTAIEAVASEIDGLRIEPDRARRLHAILDVAVAEVRSLQEQIGASGPADEMPAAKVISLATARQRLRPA